MKLRKASRGRKVFAYVLASRARAETFLKRNGDRAIPANPQKELELSDTVRQHVMSND
jgi:hypothetical protein